MGVINRMLGREKRANTTIKSSDPYLASWFGSRNGTGAYVNPEDAGGLAVAYACISLIATTLASMPLRLHKRDENGGRLVADDHPLHGVLHDLASDDLPAFEAREMLIAQLLTSGNAFAEIEWNGRGQCTALKPIHYSHVTTEITKGKPRYLVQTKDGRRVLLRDEMLHLRHRRGPDGVNGLGPIQLARGAFNLSLEQSKQAHKMAERALRPSGVLNLAHAIGSDGKEGILDKIAEKAEDSSGRGGILVIDGGSTWQPTAFAPKDAEFLDSRKLSNLDIARIFHCPPTTVGIVDNATYSNVFGENQAFVSRCLAPLAKRIEQALNAALLPEGSRAKLYVEHDLSALLRGDLATRYTAYSQARQAGFMSVNDIRARENMPRVENGDDLLQPLNMTTLGAKNADVE